MKKPRKVRSVRIHPVDNGYKVTTEHEPDGDEGMMAPSDEHVFGHHEHDAMMNHVAAQVPPPKSVK